MIFYSSALFGSCGIFSDPRFYDGDDNGDSAGEKAGDAITFKNQADLDTLIQKRLDRQKESLAKDLREQLKGELKTELESEKTAEELKEQGKFEPMYNAEVAKVTKLEKDLKDLKDTIAERDLGDLRKTVAAKYKLPDEIADRLKGSTEEEITADAKDLAKKLNLKEEEEQTGETGKPNPNRRRPVDNDAGKGNRTARPSGEKPGEEGNTGKTKAGFAFVKEGDVSWGNG